MKKNPGKTIMLALLLWSSQLLASHLADFTLTANKQSAYVKEPVEITFTATQADRTNNMFFFLEPQKSDDYEIELLRKDIVDNTTHHNVTTFRYVLFPLRSGNIDVVFRFTVKTASDRGVAHAYVEDHDDSVGIRTDATQIAVSPLSLAVKGIKEPVDLVGDFTLKHTIDHTETNAYDTVNLTYTLTGIGYKNTLRHLLRPIEGVTIFSDRDDTQSKLTPDGYRQQQVFTYALSAQKDYTIPALTLRAFSPKKQRYYTLSAPEFTIQVHPIDTQELLDQIASPASKKIDFAGVMMWLTYLLIFAAGFITARLLPRKLVFKRKKKRFEDIRAAKDPKSLIVLLVNRYRTEETEPFITQLETLAYSQKGKSSFKKLKASLLKTLEQQ